MDLAPRELALLRALLARPGQAVAKERLLELVFPGEAEVQADAIEVVAYRLRKKLAGTGAQLVTLRGLGYLLKAGRLSSAAPRLVAAQPAAAGHPAAGAGCSSRSTPSACTGRRCAPPTPPTTARCWPSPSRIGEQLEVTGSGGARAAAGHGALLRAGGLRGRQPQPHVLPGQRLRRARWSRASRTCRPGAAACPAKGPTPRWWTSTTTVPRRAGARGRAAAAGGRAGRPRHGHHPGGRDAGAAPDAGPPDPVRHAVAPGAAAGGDRGVVVWVVQRATRPVRELSAQLRAAQRERPVADRRRTRAARTAAADRRHQPGDGAAGAPAGPPEALRARHLAPAAHAAGGAEDAGAVGAARRRGRRRRRCRR